MAENYTNLGVSPNRAEDVQSGVESMSPIEPMFKSDGNTSGLPKPVFSKDHYTNLKDELSRIIPSYDPKANALWMTVNNTENNTDNRRSGFSLDNRIHEHARLEGALLGDDKINEGYLLLEEILNRVKWELDRQPDLSSEEKTALVYKIMTDLDIKFGNPKTDLLFENLSQRRLDCDTSSFVVMAVGHELGWPVHLVRVTGHVFVRWQEEKKAFNIDYGKNHPDKYYTHRYTIGLKGIKCGTDYFAIVHSNLGIFLSDSKRYKEAETEYRKAIDLDPNGAATHYNLGNTLSKLKRYEEAEAEYKNAIGLDPRDAEAHHNLGFLLYDLKRYEEAEVEYRKAIELDYDYVKARCNLGLTLFNLKKYEEAEKEYRKAIELEPKHVNAHYNLGMLLFELKRYEEAAAEYRKVLELDPDDVDARNELNIVLSKLGQQDEAKAEHEKAPNLGL